MSEKKEMLFIINPVAGRGKASDSRDKLLELFSQAGYIARVFITYKSGEAKHIAAQEGGLCDIAVCSGGDGTFHEMLSGIMTLEDRPVIGYIPTGTTNDFASNMGIPKDPIRAARIIIEGEPFQCDIGAFNDEYFSYTAAFGAFTNVPYTTPQDLKNSIGKTAYVLEVVKNLQKLQSYRVQIRCNEWAFDDEFIFGVVANSLSIAGIKGLMGRTVEMDDGLMEAMFIRKPPNAVVLGDVAQRVLSGKPYHEYIISFKAREIEIESSKMPWTLDGEYGGMPDKVVIKDLPRAVTIMRANQS